MFKRAAIVLAVCCGITLAAASASQGLSYSSPGFHYHMELPDEWDGIPQEDVQRLEEFMKSSVKGNAAARINLEAAFQLAAAREILQYPYIIVLQHPAGTRSFRQLTRALSRENVSEGMEEVKGAINDLVRDFAVGDIRIDPSRNAIFMDIEANVVDVGKVRSLVALYPGSQGMAQIMCCSTEAESAQYLPVFHEILNSFGYEPGYEYTAEQESIVRVKGLLRDVITVTFIALLVIHILQRRKNREAVAQREAA